MLVPISSLLSKFFSLIGLGRMKLGRPVPARVRRLCMTWPTCDSLLSISLRAVVCRIGLLLSSLKRFRMTASGACNLRLVLLTNVCRVVKVLSSWLSTLPNACVRLVILLLLALLIGTCWARLALSTLRVALCTRCKGDKSSFVMNYVSFVVRISDFSLTVVKCFTTAVMLVFLRLVKTLMTKTLCRLLVLIGIVT